MQINKILQFCNFQKSILICNIYYIHIHKLIKYINLGKFGSNLSQFAPNSSSFFQICSKFMQIWSNYSFEMI